jgi:Zn-dependent peptidase ImmA (M78 family)
MSVMKTLIQHATSLGLRVHAAHLDGDDLGLYSPDEGRIYFDIRLTPNERCSVLAHELGHAHYGHDCRSAKHERQARAYAARLLIDPQAYAELEMQGVAPADIADELNVTEQVVDDYRSMCLSRIGRTTYATPKMGSGQWGYRA